MENTISVIVPIYNKEKYLKKCIDSILNQSYTNLDVILINDGSIDNSNKICEEYASNDKRIRYISTENRGAARARNTGIETAKGEYISFIDADDYIEQSYFETLINLVNQYQADFAECGFDRVLEGEEYTFPNKKEQIRVMTRKETLIELYGKDDDEHVKNVIMCNKLFKRKLFDNIAYVPGRVIDDETIIYKLINKSEKIVDLQDTLYAYVQSSNSIMRNNFSMKRLDDTIDVYDECISFFKDEPEIQACCIKRAVYFYSELLQNIITSDNVDKTVAFNRVTEKYDEKMKCFANIPYEAKQSIEINSVIKSYHDRIKLFTK
ncbi:MAG: glycosyltransferase [Clostridia bacterium]|nr:glycosyltransferase [Clostridia bacterium]